MSTVLTDTALQELLASSRAHGVYDEELKNYVASGEKGIEINLAEGTFAGKKAASVKTGFMSALERTKKPVDSKGAQPPLGDGVDVAIISKDEKVYLIRQDLVAPVPAVASAPASTPTEPAGDEA